MHSRIRPIKGFQRWEVLDEDDSAKVLRGLALISLEHSGFDFHGLTQPQADYIISDLSGSVEDFFYPILGRHDRFYF